jgi:hypothetical protein
MPRPAQAPPLVTDASISAALSFGDWMLILTALGHYAGVLGELNMNAEQEKLLRIYESLLRSMREN